MSELEDPFDDFKRKREDAEQQKKFQQKFQPSQVEAAKQVSRERLEKVSDYFPAYVAQQSSTAIPAARPAPAPAVDPRLKNLCHLLMAKGLLSAEEVQKILSAH